MIEKIEKNYALMVENYQVKHKSDHWVGRFKASKLGKIKKIDYQNFRRPKLFGNNYLQDLMMNLDLFHNEYVY